MQAQQPAVLPEKARQEKIEDYSGAKRTLAEFQSKVVLLVFVGRGSGEAGGKISSDIALELVKETDLVRVTVADLEGVPGFLRGQIRDSVRKAAKEGEQKTEVLFKAKGLPYAPQNAALTLLDWRGTLVHACGVRGKTERTYQIVVLDRQGQIVFRITQPPKAGVSPLPATAAALQTALAAKSAARKIPGGPDR